MYETEGVALPESHRPSPLTASLFVTLADFVRRRADQDTRRTLSVSGPRDYTEATIKKLLALSTTYAPSRV